MLEDRLDAPKAAASKNSRLLALGGGQRRIDSRSRERDFRSFRRPRAKSTESGPGDEPKNQDESDAAADIRALHGWPPGMPILVYSFSVRLDAVRSVLDRGRFAVVRQLRADSARLVMGSCGDWNRATA